MDLKEVYKDMGDQNLIEATRTALEEVKSRALPASILGPLATRGAEFEVVVGETADEKFTGKVKQFLNPEVRMSSEDQLCIMQEFWQRLGYQMPKLSEAEEIDLKKAMEVRRVSTRLIPTPLIAPARRSDLVERARVLPWTDFGRNPLWTHDEEQWTLGDLLYSGTVLEEGTNIPHGLRYWTTDGQLVSREEYIKLLKEQNQVVRADNGKYWRYEFVNAGEPGNQEYVLRERAQPTVLPETLLVKGILAQAVPSDIDSTPEFANEVICRLKDDLITPKRPFELAVVWAREGSIDLDYWGLQDRLGYFAHKGAEAQRSYGTNSQSNVAVSASYL